MDITTTVALVAGVILGAAGGYAVAVLITRAGQQTEAARGDADGARQEAYVAQARTEAAQARSETAQVRAESAQARTDVAEARALAAAAQAEAAEVSAAVARAEAERDAAVEHARELAADREQMLAQFKVMSTETIDRQSLAANAQADARLKATEQLLGPVKDSPAPVPRPADRGGEGAGGDRGRSARPRCGPCSRPASSCAGRPRRWSRPCASRRCAGRGARRSSSGWPSWPAWSSTATSTSSTPTPADDRVHATRHAGRPGRGQVRLRRRQGAVEAFLDAAGDRGRAAGSEALTRFAQNVRTHVDQLVRQAVLEGGRARRSSSCCSCPARRSSPPRSTRCPDLYEYACRRDVVLATPTTLIGMLRAVAYGWKQAALAENAAEVFQLGRELHERLGPMGSRFDKLGRARPRLGQRLQRDRRHRGGHGCWSRPGSSATSRSASASCTTVTSVDDPVRQIQAPELVEDAVQVEPMVGRAVGGHAGRRG